jgi:hypothetical protein
MSEVIVRVGTKFVQMGQRKVTLCACTSSIDICYYSSENTLYLLIPDHIHYKYDNVFLTEKKEKE